MKKTLHADEQKREDVRLLRERWLQELPFLDPEKLVFIDESGAKTNMTRLRGRALKGQRLFSGNMFATYSHPAFHLEISS